MIICGNYLLRFNSSSSNTMDSSVIPDVNNGASHIIYGRINNVMTIPITAPPKCAECPMRVLALCMPNVEKTIYAIANIHPGRGRGMGNIIIFIVGFSITAENRTALTAPDAPSAE